MDLTRRALLQAAPAVLTQPSRPSRPNILLLMTDQHRADFLGAAGARWLHTPNLDRLAAGGTLFRHAYSSTPTCTPARAALLTGQSPWHHGMLGYGQVAEKYAIEMPRLLADAGYHTTGVGKMHWHPQRALHGFHQTLLDESGREESADFRSDYRSWFYSERPGSNPEPTGIDWNGYAAKPFPIPEHLHPTAWTGETAVRWLRGYHRPEPFFLKVSFARPHSPYDPPQRWWDIYSDRTPPAARAGAWAERYRKPLSNAVNVWHGDLGADVVRNARRGYAGSISFIDEHIGRILATLDERRMLDNTLIVMLADHGDMLGDQNLWRKSYAYEPSARIPLIVRAPGGLSAGRVLDHPVEIRDVLPTLLDAAGVTVPDGVDGRSLLAPMRNERAPWREYIDLEHDVCYSPQNHWTALTDGRRKYIFHAATGEEQFFDMEKDPGELARVTDSPELGLWRGRMAAHLAERGEAWVSGGRLQRRPESQLYSPNYPAAKFR
jgi:arylsulfatase A-like enzyme